MLKGFKLDIECHLMKDEHEFRQYARYVSGTTVTMTQFIIWNKYGEWPDAFAEIGPKMITDGFVFGS